MDSKVIKQGQICPIIVMAFNRPNTLKETLRSLSTNELADQSDLFVYIDGPRENKLGEKELVEQVIEVAKTTTGFKSVEIKTSDHNKGLAKSIIGAVTEIINQYGKIILVEDDLYLAPSFLIYMNQMLDYFEGDKRVFQVSGYSSLIKRKIDSDVYLNGRGQCWSWGTWKDRWETIDWEITDFEDFKKNKRERRRWAQFGSDLYSMLKSWKEGRLNSWWIRFSYNMFKQKRYTICPVQSLVRNDGFGVESTHCNAYDRYRISFDGKERKAFYIPSDLKWDAEFNSHATRYWSIRYRVYGKCMTYLYKIIGKHY